MQLFISIRESVAVLARKKKNLGGEKKGDSLTPKNHYIIYFFVVYGCEAYKIKFKIINFLLTQLSKC